MNGATFTVDIGNFRNATRFYSVSHADRIVDTWPDRLDSIYEEQPVHPPVTVPPGANEHQRQLAATFYARQYFIMRHDTAVSAAMKRSYRLHCEMNLLAVLRPENWENQGIIDRIQDGQVTAREYRIRSPNPIHDHWDGRDETAWRRGYIRFYEGANVYLRDARPLDPTNDPTTISESASARGDNRVSTFAQVILESEIDRTDSAVRGPDQPWTEQAAWVARVGSILGD